MYDIVFVSLGFFMERSELTIDDVWVLGEYCHTWRFPKSWGYLKNHPVTDDNDLKTMVLETSHFKNTQYDDLISIINSRIMGIESDVTWGNRQGL